MTDPKAKGLHAKLAEVMAEAGRIPKNGKAPAAMGGFPFVQVGDAADHIRKALGERGVSMLPSEVRIVGQNEHQTAKGGTMTTVELITKWTLTDGETGQTAVIDPIKAKALQAANQANLNAEVEIEDQYIPKVPLWLMIEAVGDRLDVASALEWMIDPSQEGRKDEGRKDEKAKAE